MLILGVILIFLGLQVGGSQGLLLILLGAILLILGLPPVALG